MPDLPSHLEMGLAHRSHNKFDFMPLVNETKNYRHQQNRNRGRLGMVCLQKTQSTSTEATTPAGGFAATKETLTSRRLCRA